MRKQTQSWPLEQKCTKELLTFQQRTKNEGKFSSHGRGERVSRKQENPYNEYYTLKKKRRGSKPVVCHAGIRSLKNCVWKEGGLGTNCDMSLMRFFYDELQLENNLKISGSECVS